MVSTRFKFHFVTFGQESNPDPSNRCPTVLPLKTHKSQAALKETQHDIVMLL